MLFQKQIETFLEKKSDKQKVIVIYWPTASGKTALSIELAKKLNTEIISTDSRQIFKEMNIWTAKITLEEMDWIKHHMVDIISPDRDYSVWEFKKDSEEIINKLFKEKKINLFIIFSESFLNSQALYALSGGIISTIWCLIQSISSFVIFAVQISICLKICLESVEIISVSSFFATPIDIAVFQEAVGQ
jgi:uncharacterized Tic20 family protein